MKNRIHATLMTFGHPVSVSDLFGVGGRALLKRLAIPEPWATTLETSLQMVDELNLRIDAGGLDCHRLVKRPVAEHHGGSCLRGALGMDLAEQGRAGGRATPAEERLDSGAPDAHTTPGWWADHFR